MSRILSIAIVALGVVTLTALSARAQNTRPFELAYSDGELNAAYKGVMARLRDEDKIKLRHAQRAWIAFRDADCKLAIADVRDCLIERTDQRTVQLRETYYWDRSGEIFNIQND